MVGGDHFPLPREGSEDPAEILAAFLPQYYEDGALIPRNVLCETLPEEATEQLESWLRQQKGAAVTLATPKRGEKHDLVRLAAKNAADALDKRNAKAAIQQERTIGACAGLAKALGLAKPPRRIEGYDISNTQGQLSVASMVVFIDGTAAKKEYRRFRIKTVEGANDFASMNEVLGRRFARGLEEKAEREAASLPAIGGKFSDLPDLVLIDGGPQQLRFARQALLDMGAGEVAMFGLAKKEEEIFLPDREEPICLDHHTPELHLVQRVRDEAHRFGITYHRALRGKAFVHSQLEDIPGIGPTRRKALMNRFGSIKGIRAAEEADLLATPSMNRTAVDAVLKWQAQKK